MLLVPHNITGDVPSTLVVELHGMGDTNQMQFELSAFAQLAVEQNFIVAYPQGEELIWSLDVEEVDNGMDDVGFLLAVIEHIKEMHSIDENRIYMTGWSMGCMMTQLFAHEAQGILASAGCMSGYLMKDVSATISIPIPFMEIHGVLDSVVQYADNSVNFMIGFQSTRGLNVGAMQNLERWSNLNGCSGVVPEVFDSNDDFDIRGYSECENGVEVRLMSLYLARHNPYINDHDVHNKPGNPTDTPSTRILWEFMSQYEKQEFF
ncbi:MAG: PHB depolymerase family esterase [Candidatus Thermoplasmatota archaeon]|nr:PHB depolymerase family esterase [Candidatus Thermoplasmatota archaeon]